MCHVRILLLAGCLGLLAAGPVGAQTFHQIYGLSGQAGELTSVASTSTPGAAIASGNFDVGSTQGVLLKVQPAGTLDWVRAYGLAQISAVRETPGSRYAWIGTRETPQGSAPVVAEVEPDGTAVRWAQVIRLFLPDGTPAVHAYGRFLEYDRGTYWVGGEVWFPTADQPQPWLGKLNDQGDLMWAKTLRVPNSARFHSIFPAFEVEGGIIAVGQRWPEDDRDRTRMLAVRLGDSGGLKWAFDYRVTNAAGPAEQRLADLDRDPRIQERKSAVVGTVANFCRSVPSAPCDRVESAAFVADLDESTGMLSNAHGLVSASQDQPKTFGETIVQDLAGETIAVGGEIEENRPISKGFLALLGWGMSSVRKASLHSANITSNTFDASLRSLDRWRQGTESGYLFMVNETNVLATPARHRSLVKTNRDGNSGTCEQDAELKLYDAWLEQSKVPVEMRDGRAEPIKIQVTSPKLEQKPCKVPAAR